MALLATLLTAICSPAASSAQAPVAPPGYFGVNVNGYQSGDFRPMADANVGVARNVVPFQVLKHGKNEPYFWGYTDPIVKGLAENGIDLIPMIYGAPSWISHDLNHTVLRGKSAKAWDELLTALVQRYGPGGQFWLENEYTPYHPIQTWQIWNEPNSITWWGPKPNPSEYAKVLVRSAATIHSLDPAARIVTAGIVARPTNRSAIPGKKFLTKLFSQPGVTESVSAVAIHPYAPSVSGVRKQLVDARRVLNRMGASATPIIVTEIGWGAKGPKDHPLIKSVGSQSRTLKATFEMVLKERERLGIERLLWYQWRDGPDELCLWCETSGLLDKKSRPKKLMKTFSAIATR